MIFDFKHVSIFNPWVSADDIFAEGTVTMESHINFLAFRFQQQCMLV